MIITLHLRNAFIFDLMTISTKILRKRGLQRLKDSSQNIWYNPFHATCLFLDPLKRSGRLWFSNIFRACRKRPVAQNCCRKNIWSKK